MPCPNKPHSFFINDVFCQTMPEVSGIPVIFGQHLHQHTKSTRNLMNTTLRSALCCLLVLALGACAEETGPETTVVNAKVDGVPFTSQAVTNVHATSSLRFTAVQAATSDTIIIDMPKIQGTGSLVIGGKGGVVAEYRAPGKYFTSIDTINTVQGSVDVSQFDDKGAVGTFTFQIYQNKDFNGDIAVVNEGSFSIKF